MNEINLTPIHQLYLLIIGIITILVVIYLIRENKPVRTYINKRRAKKMKRLFAHVGNVIPYNYKTEKKLKRVAIDLHKFTGKQYHVVPVDVTKVTIVDNTRLKAYNKTAKKGEKITYLEIIKKAYFTTSRATNSIKEDN